MAASMASQAAARGLRTATSKHILLDKLKLEGNGRSTGAVKPVQNHIDEQRGIDMAAVYGPDQRPGCLPHYGRSKRRKVVIVWGGQGGAKRRKEVARCEARFGVAGCKTPQQSVQCTWLSPRRWLNLQEYQSKKLMQESGVAVQRFFVADTASEALEAAKRLKLLLPTMGITMSRSEDFVIHTYFRLFGSNQRSLLHPNQKMYCHDEHSR
ncbi:hypothetical protein INR49_012609 [Caranx melampygus]|nr:hypothetical protein INR49_012609 [Caranx melampygus]